jgi:uncharacterized membrane protein HdeD (DUF308 family)
MRDEGESAVPAYGPPWKLMLIGAVAIVAGIALLRLDWTLAELVAFTGMFLIARGALHVVTTSFKGVSGGLATLQGAVEIGIGVVLLAWPDPTLLVLMVAVGSLAIAQGTIDATLVLATRTTRPVWGFTFVTDVGQIAIGLALVLVRTSSVRTSALLLGLLAIVAGSREVVIGLVRARGVQDASTAGRSAPVAAEGLVPGQISEPAT